MDDHDHDMVRRWSVAMAHICVLAAILFVVGSAWRAATMTPTSVSDWLVVPHVVFSNARWAGLYAAIIAPAAITACGLLRLRMSFYLFARGDIFSEPAIRGLQIFAGTTFIAVIVAAVATPMIGIWLTIDTVEGFDIPVHIGTGSITLLLMSGFTWVFARIMAIMAAVQQRNRELAQENASFV